MHTNSFFATPRPKTGIFWALVLLFSAGLLSGCEEEVNPFIGTEFPFTVWGFVNPKADTQVVRVFTIDDQLRLIPEEPLDATVSVINLTDEQRYVLQDSAILLNNGEYRHVFWSEFPVDFGETYRLEVERSDGIVTKSSDVLAPLPVSISVLEPDLNAISEILLPIDITGNPPSMPRIDALYETYSINGEGLLIAENPVSISYVAKPILRNDVWHMNIDLQDDFLAIREDFTNREIEGFICMNQLTLNVHVVNEEWRSPIGEFDPDFLVEPGTLSNIENGFGLFGAGYIESVSWVPPLVMQVRAGFFDCIGR
jgi:hypothetical protein